MSIRKKILIYFSSTVIILTGLSLYFIYSLFTDYREEAFRQRQIEKIESNMFLLAKMKEMDERIVQAMDDLTIHDFYDEKMLIFDQHKNNIYTSLDDLVIKNVAEILDSLSPSNPEVRLKESDYDVLGIYTFAGYYGISKAYDTQGYSTLFYLRTVLLVTFFLISSIVILISYYLSRRIADPVTQLIRTIHHYDFETDDQPIVGSEGRDELALLAARFNELMERMNRAFRLQKHVIHHISHELKTPIAVLVSNLEKMESISDPLVLQKMIREQKVDTHNLSEIINALLEISKVETAKHINTEEVRVDELLFDISEELIVLHPDFIFSIDYDDDLTLDDSRLWVMANRRLLYISLMNLMLNAVHYSADGQAKIRLSYAQGMLEIVILNRGMTISNEEQNFLFQHFFRGQNSKGKRGFGLGLVLTHKVIALHGGSIFYTAEDDNTNVFMVTLPCMGSER